MGLTESSDLIDEHWIDRELEQKAAPPKEEPLSTGTTASTSLKNGLNKTQQANLRKKTTHKIIAQEADISLNEDELNEEKMWIDAISLEPKSSRLRNQLANHYFSLNRLKEAEFAYRAAINLDAKNSIAHYDYAFMRHHQFYWCLAKLDMDCAYKYATECKQHYCEVLSLEGDDIETHYQLSLLYLTMLETTLIESIDNIESPLVSAYEQYMSRNNKMRKGMHSKWYQERKEIHSLCVQHLKITMDSCSDLDAVLFGTYITWARLLYLECVPNCFIFFELNTKQKMDKLRLAVSYLTAAAEINQNDATLHHDLGLILSHELIAKYNEAIYHWTISHKLDGTNPIYTQQIGYIYQYHLGDTNNACKYYHLSLKMYEAQESQQRHQASQRMRTQASIWNNLGIISAQNAKTQNDIIYATKCWNQCLSKYPNHCEAHRNLGNILWLHFYDENKGEIHLQRAIATSSQVYNKMMRINAEDGYFVALRDKFAKFLSQSKSDYGGLLLMMFKYDTLAEKQLRDALEYDVNCVSAHYYLGKYLFDFKREYVESAAHLNKYIELEAHNKNSANRAHSHQILGEILLRKWFKFKEAQRHFALAIEIMNKSQSPIESLPLWAQCKMYCGSADCVIKSYLNIIYDEYGAFKSMKTQNFINELRSQNFSNEKHTEKKMKSQLKEFDLVAFQENIERAKKNYRLVLKMDKNFVGAPLGLAIIFGKIEGKIKLSEKNYNLSIKICKEKLIKLFEKYEIEMKKGKQDKKLAEMQQKRIEKYYKKKHDDDDDDEEEDKEKEEEQQQDEEEKEKNDDDDDESVKKIKFTDGFKLNMKDIAEILTNDECDINLIRVVREIKDYMMLCIESHLGKVDLIMISYHNGNNKWKEALAHCNQSIYLDANNITAHCKKALLYFKLRQTKKAIQVTQYVMQLAKEYDARNKGNKKTIYVKHTLALILKAV